MKKILIMLLAAWCMVSCTSEDKKINVRWATFNLRYDNQGDAPNHWGARKERVAQYIKDTKIDVFGTQEVLHHQFEDLKAMLPNFEAVGVGRDDGKTKGEYSAVYYRKDKFTALDSGIQMKVYLEGMLGESNQTCAVIYSDNKKKLEKRYVKMRKRYQTSKNKLLRQIGTDTFRFHKE